MPLTIRPADARGHANHGWLDSHHSFSFANYYDARHMGFGPLRVINEDRVAPGGGFDTHGHRDMEILSYVIDGALEHRDSIGTGSVIRPGDVQVMSAGTGIRHSEFNHSKSEPVHFLQIWLLPGQQGLAPRYDQKSFPDATKRGQLRLIASADARDGSVLLHQDADVSAAILDDGGTVEHRLKAGRSAWVQMVRGELSIGDATLRAGDGVAITGEARIVLAAHARDTEFLLFDLPPAA